MQQSRLILYHKQSTSGLTRFLKMPHGGVSAFEPLPMPATLMDGAPMEAVASHPASLMVEAEQRLGMQSGDLEVDSCFQAWVDVARGPIQYILVRFTNIDPPFAEAEKLGGEFINLTDGRHLVPPELELLRLAYECVMEG